MAGGDRIGPGERFQVLTRLSRFASREELTIKVVFGGRPLREAADGDEYNGVDVYYGDDYEQVKARLRKTLNAAGKSRSVLVTSDAQWEADFRADGYEVMRLSTLRKAMDGPAAGDGGYRDGGRGPGGRSEDGGRGRGRSRGRGRGGRDGRDRRQGDGGNRQPAEGNNGSNGENAPGGRAPEGSQAGSGGGGDASVKNLIDLVE
jgi:hypothetical protein